jgi:hypothetical protein
MILPQENGLAALVERGTGGQATTYLDGEKVSIHWYGASPAQLDHLKALVANYIDAHMMMGSYSSVAFFT